MDKSQKAQFVPRARDVPLPIIFELPGEVYASRESAIPSPDHRRFSARRHCGIAEPGADQ